ncbi:hypothetical protein VNO77_21127 [Canavalia gladiata]|uniref:Uncharacterized protein n=1 Tax=Canavalia gladiata TaxID=3824 RepID=A0AAN9LQH8_CANGL
MNSFGSINILLKAFPAFLFLKETHHTTFNLAMWNLIRHQSAKADKCLEFEADEQNARDAQSKHINVEPITQILQYTLLWLSINRGNDQKDSSIWSSKTGKNVLPISWNDLRDKAAPEIALNLKAFLCFVLLSVNGIPPQAYFAMLILCCSFLSYQAKNLTAPFEFQFGNSTNTPPSLLSFGDAFAKFLPEITHITRFMLIYLITLMLAWPLHLGVQFLIVLLLISAPLYYFPELVAKASGTSVACGSFKLPLIWFTTLGALALSFICVLLTLLVIYLSWRYIYEGRPRVKELKASMDDLTEILYGVM